jgi:hypothetical protein
VKVPPAAPGAFVTVGGLVCSFVGAAFTVYIGRAKKADASKITIKAALDLTLISPFSFSSQEDR